jgi:hypothetical protein
VLQDVIFDHFGDESVQSASTSGRLLQDGGTARILVDPAFSRVDLPPDASQSDKQLPLLFF